MLSYYQVCFFYFFFISKYMFWTILNIHNPSTVCFVITKYFRSVLRWSDPETISISIFKSLATKIKNSNFYLITNICCRSLKMLLKGSKLLKKCTGDIYDSSYSLLDAYKPYKMIQMSLDDFFLKNRFKIQLKICMSFFKKYT